MTVTGLGKPATGDYAREEARLRRELAAVYLAWEAMLRLVERVAPDYRN